MGKVVSAITGHGGGGKTTEKTTAKSDSTNQSWLMNNDAYKNYLNQAINEAGNYNTPQFQLADENGNMLQALNNLANGINPQGYKDAQQFMQALGNKYLQQGDQGLQQAQGTLSQFQNMSQQDYQNMMKSEYNSDLVKSQIGQLTDTINDQTAHQIEALNQQATGSGNMGNSRAGVAQGAITGNAAKAIASGTVQYQTAEEQNAYNRLNGYINTRIGTANTQAQIAQNQLNAGYQGYNQGMNYFNQYNQTTLQNWQNQLTAGNMQRQLQQQQLDVERQNQLLNQSPALQRLMMLNQGMLPLAGLQSTGTQNGSGTVVTNTPGGGNNLLSSFMGAGMQGLGSYMGFGSQGQAMMGAFGGSFGNQFGS
ncbi:TPA: hypothetical protein RFV54_001061 [Klebsiella aerogenes]|nr:hypothetical protein [Klebsiella aerogenes]